MRRALLHHAGHVEDAHVAVEPHDVVGDGELVLDRVVRHVRVDGAPVRVLVLAPRVDAVLRLELVSQRQLRVVHLLERRLRLELGKLEQIREERYLEMEKAAAELMAELGRNFRK